jgi:hypothetical protein
MKKSSLLFPVNFLWLRSASKVFHIRIYASNQRLRPEIYPLLYGAPAARMRLKLLCSSAQLEQIAEKGLKNDAQVRI